MRLAGRPLIAALAALAAIGPLSTSLYLPSLPALRDALGASVGEAQLTLSASLIGFALLQLAFGPLSDRFGRRRTLAGGLLVYVAANVVCAIAGRVETLIWARFVQGVGGCAGQVVARAVVRDQFPPARIAGVMAVIGMSVSLAPTVAPLLGGQLQELFGWRANFVVLVGAGLVLLAMGMALPESPTAGGYGVISFRRVASDYRILLADRAFLANTLALGLGFGGLFAYVAGAPILLIERLHVAPSLYGVYTAIGPIGFVLGAHRARRPRGSPARNVRVGAAVSLGGALALLAPALAGHLSIVALIAPMFVFSVGLGLAMPNAMMGALAPWPKIAGTASALMGFLQMAVGAAGSASVALLPGETDLLMAATVTACAAGALAAAFAIRR